MEHNAVRDLVLDYCSRGGMQAESETPGILANLPVPEGRRRPTNVLVCRGLQLAPRLPDGSQQASCSRVALDFAIINALGQSHWDDTFREPGAAAEAYTAQKRRHLDTSRKCREAGVLFMPMVLEAQGGMAREAAGVFHRIAAAVAEREHAEVAKVREELLQRLALTRVRANDSAIARRRVARQSPSNIAVANFEAATAHLEEPSEV